MAVQFNFEELENCPGYFTWMVNLIHAGESNEKDDNNNHHGDICGDESVNNHGSDRADSALVEVCRVMFETDFIWDEKIKEDEIRATDAMQLRRKYAEDVGRKANKSLHDIDRIWKSIHGKCSTLEVILSMCGRLDEMVNEDEPGTMVGMFFRILARNLGFDFCAEKELSKEDISAIVCRFLKREYNEDGSGGGLFPIQEWSLEKGSKDQRQVSIWYQMNAWLAEHLDDEEHFVEEKFA